MLGNSSRSIFHIPTVAMRFIRFTLVLALILATPLLAGAVIVFTGDAPADFAESNSVTDGEGLDVGTPPGWPFPFSGWDIQALYFDYDADADTASFGVDFFGVAGDADGDGDPGVSSADLTVRGGTDLPNLALTESIAVFFDVNRDVAQGGDFDFAVGIPGGNSPNGEPLDCGVGAKAFSLQTCFGLFDVDNDALQGVNRASMAFLAKRSEVVIGGTSPSEERPDFEFAIPQWSILLAKSGVLIRPCEAWSIDVHLFAGSFLDDGVGEDTVPNQGRVVTLNFPIPASGLCSCLEELNLCEETLDTSLADSDGDGTSDTIDQCPNTVASASTDLLGCSREQFCGKFSGRRLHCSLADWKNDEPVAARDCRYRRGTCIPR